MRLVLEREEVDRQVVSSNVQCVRENCLCRCSPSAFFCSVFNVSKCHSGQLIDKRTESTLVQRCQESPNYHKYSNLSI